MFEFRFLIWEGIGGRSSDSCRLGDGAQDWQVQLLRPICQFWSRNLRQERFGKLDDLFGALKEHVVLAVAVVLAFVGCVAAADLRTVLVDAAAMVLLQVVADVVDHQIPRFAIDENGDSAVDQVPAEVVEILLDFRRFDRQSEVPAALRGTVVTETFAGFQVSTENFGLGHEIHLGQVSKRTDDKGAAFYRSADLMGTNGRPCETPAVQASESRS